MFEHFRRLLDPTLLVLVAVFTAGLRLALAAGLFGIPLALILVSWLFKYAYVLLEDVAYGSDKPRVLSVEMVNPLQQRPLAQLAICGLAVMAVGFVGGVAGTILGTAFALMLPASVAILGASGNVLQAINPLALIRVAMLLGRHYLVILMTVATAAAGLWALAVSSAPTTLQIAFALFAILAIFDVIGGALYERRSVLDLATVQSPEQLLEREERTRVRERSRLLDGLYVLARARKYAELDETLERHLASLSTAQLTDDGPVLIAAARSWGDHRALSIIAGEVISWLHAAKLDVDALDAFASALDEHATFHLARCLEGLELAELATAAGRRPLARRIAQSCLASGPDKYESKRLERLRARLER